MIFAVNVTEGSLSMSTEGPLSIHQLCPCQLKDLCLCMYMYCIYELKDYYTCELNGHWSQQLKDHCSGELNDHRPWEKNGTWYAKNPLFMADPVILDRISQIFLVPTKLTSGILRRMIFMLTSVIIIFSFWPRILYFYSVCPIRCVFIQPIVWHTHVCNQRASGMSPVFIVYIISFTFSFLHTWPTCVRFWNKTSYYS